MCDSKCLDKHLTGSDFQFDIQIKLTRYVNVDLVLLDVDILINSERASME